MAPKKVKFVKARTKQRQASLENTLFLYIDVLGFTELIKDRGKVEWLFQKLDGAAFFRDSNYRAIVFSDTILVYNQHRDLRGRAKATELMYLIELTQEFFLRLIGSGIFFRAVITEGEFTHRRVSNFDAFYGPALVETYNGEKSIKAVGLFLDSRLRIFNQIFRWRKFSEKYDFIYLTHQATGLTPKYSELMGPSYMNRILADPMFPLPEIMIEGPGIECLVYPEVIHFKEVYRLKREHPSVDVRRKFRTTWRFYWKAYPKLLRSLILHKFSPRAIAPVNWKRAKKVFLEDKNGSQ